jgi:PAS domain S-box-containing protein
MRLDSLGDLIVAGAADGIVVANEDGIIVEWNRAAEQISGIPRLEATGQAFWDLQMRLLVPERRSPEMRDRYREWILDACRTGQAPWLGRVLEADMLRADGSRRIVQQTAFPIRTDKGFMIGSSARDVTEQRTAERARAQREVTLAKTHKSLRKAEERYRQMFQNNQAIKWLVDPETGAIVDANEAAAHFYGYALDQLKRMTIFDLNVLPRDQVVAAMRQARSEAKVTFTFKHRLASGEVRDVEVNSGPLTVQGRTLLFSIIHDISDRFRAEEALRRRNRQLEILHEIDRAILEAQSVKALAEVAVRQTRRLIPCERVGLVTFDRHANEAQMLAVDTDGPTGLAAGIELPLDEFWPAAERAALECAIVPDIEALPVLTTCDRVLLADGMRSYVRIPLLAGGAVIGSLNLTRRATGALEAEQLATGRSVADSLAVAIQHAHLNEQVRSSREQLQSLSHRLVEVHERERGYVAAALYDDVGQRLAALLIGLRLLEQEIVNAGLSNDRIVELKRQAADMLADLHNLAVHLRPAGLERLGLVPAIKQYLEQFGSERSLRVELTTVGMDEERPTQDLELALYWIVQEALNNVARHAQASQIGIVVQRYNDRLKLIVEDNGIGFDANRVVREGHLGLFSLSERAAMLNGKLSLETGPGRGTTVYVEIPWQGRANASNSSRGS